MSVLLTVGTGSEPSPFPVNPSDMVMCFLDAVHAAYALPLPTEEYDVVVINAEGSEELHKDATLAEAGVVGVDERVEVRPAKKHIARFVLAEAGIGEADAPLRFEEEVCAVAGGGEGETAQLIAAAGWVDTSDLLLSAALEGEADAAELLLRCGADVWARDDKGLTPLHHAAAQGYVAVTNALLDGKADPDARDPRGYTALHHTTLQSGSIDVAQLLIEYGADVQARSENGSVPLALAARADDLDMCELLMNHGAKGELAMAKSAAMRRMFQEQA